MSESGTFLLVVKRLAVYQFKEVKSHSSLSAANLRKKKNSPKTSFQKIFLKSYFLKNYISKYFLKNLLPQKVRFKKLFKKIAPSKDKFGKFFLQNCSLEKYISKNSTLKTELPKPENQVFFIFLFTFFVC